MKLQNLHIEKKIFYSTLILALVIIFNMVELGRAVTKKNDYHSKLETIDLIILSIEIINSGLEKISNAHPSAREETIYQNQNIIKSNLNIVKKNLNDFYLFEEELGKGLKSSVDEIEYISSKYFNNFLTYGSARSGDIQNSLEKINNNIRLNRIEIFRIQNSVVNHAIYTAIIVSALALIFLIIIVIKFGKDFVKKSEVEDENRILAQALKSIKESVLISDKKNNIIFINDSFKETFGYTKEDLMTHGRGIMVGTANTEELLAEVRNKTMNGGWEGEMINYKKDGTEVPIYLSTSQVKNEKGEVVAVIGISLDISEEKKKESEKEEYFVELKKKQNQVENYSKKLLNTTIELLKLQRELKQAELNKDKFFSIISHDLRTPFNSLLGFSEILYTNMQELTTEEIKTFSYNIYETAKNYVALLNNLLEWSRLQSGKIVASKKPLDLLKAVEHVQSLLNYLLVQKKVKLCIQIKPGLMVYADQNILSSVLQNLITNAVKFSYPGGEIKLSAEETAFNVKIYVIDNGVGIDKDRLDKIFKIEFLSSTPGTANEKGTGLGLLICKELIDKNGGKIFVESRQGKGTTFSFTVNKL